MGGGGSYYDRDTTDGYTRTSSGYSPTAEKLMSSSSVDKSLLPKGRRIISKAKSPVFYCFDVTGSMDNLPMIIVDKMPLIAGQITELGYLDDPEMCVAAVGDAVCDSGPFQVADYTKLRAMDDWMKRIWRENGGGGQEVESYEMMAYYCARYCDMPNAVTPFFLITADEGFRDELYKSDLERHFGGKHENISAEQVFKELNKKFKGNVFLIHRRYNRGDADAKIMKQWSKVLDKKNIVVLGSDQSIADVTLGLFAIRTGTRTLDEYLKDLKTARDVAQTDARVAEVRKALANVEPLPRRAAASSTSTKATGSKPAKTGQEADKKDGKKDKKKSGFRL